jgi:transcriptional regulator with XRE-family HTH domain
VSSDKNPTLGDILKERREALNLSLDELADSLRIPPKYLRRIERGEWDALPSEVYRKGFLKRYSAALGMDSEEVLERYAEDRDDLSRLPPEERTARDRRAVWMEAVRGISPRLARRTVVAVVFGLILGYIGYQFSVALVPPTLEISEPAAEETVARSETILLKGKADIGSEVYLNGELLALRPDGTFEQQVELLPGITILEVKAVSRFNKETIIIKKVIYQQ